MLRTSAITRELPIHARHGEGTLEPLTSACFVVAAFYALVVVIGVGAVLVLIDRNIGISIVEKHRPVLRRFLALLAAVSFVVPIAISIAQLLIGN